MVPSPERRIVILSEGAFGEDASKTARGVLRYASDPVVAVIDSTKAGRTVDQVLGHRPRYDGVPIVASLAEAMALPERPTTLILGLAPAGGKLPESWRAMIAEALRRGLDVAAGLHSFLSDDPEFAAAAAQGGAKIYDFRRPPERMEVATGRPHLPGKHVLLTVGTDCAVGKMGVSMELALAARDVGERAVVVPTGQTGMMVEGWGVTIDRVAGDFIAGTVEWLTEEGEKRADWVIVEGQGSLDHFAYSSVTLGLIHGARPHGMVMVHQPGRAMHHAFETRGDIARIKPLQAMIRAHEAIADLVEPSKVVAIALNTSLYEDEEVAKRLIAETAAATGLPADDPYRFGGVPLFEAIRARMKTEA